jgi:hypothetical protein
MRATTKVAALGVIGIAAAGFSVPASAAITTWNFSAGTPTCTESGALDTLSRTCTPAPSVTATGWANTGNGNNTTLQQAYLPLWGSNGLGVENQDRPGGPGDNGDDTENNGTNGEHAIDNEDRKDAVLLSFNTPVMLTDIEINWKRSGYGSDMTVLAFTGGDLASCGGAGIAGQTYAALTNCGWNFVRQIANAPVGSFQTINNASVYSQYWLVSTHISDIATGSATNVQSIGTPNGSTDHVKLLAVRGDPGQRVPEPGTLGLLGIAALGFWRLRRKG